METFFDMQPGDFFLYECVLFLSTDDDTAVVVKENNSQEQWRKGDNISLSMETPVEKVSVLIEIVPF